MPRSPTSSEDEMAQSFSDYSVGSESDSSKEETIYDTIRATAEKPSVARTEEGQGNTLVIRILIQDLQQTVGPIRSLLVRAKHGLSSRLPLVTFCTACPGGVLHVVHLPRPSLLPVGCAFVRLVARCWHLGPLTELLLCAGQRPGLRGTGTSLAEDRYTVDTLASEAFGAQAGPDSCPAALCSKEPVSRPLAHLLSYVSSVWPGLARAAHR